MATRKVILTERELTTLIKRIVKETEEMSNMESGKGMEDMESERGGSFSWIKRAARQVAELFKDEILPQIPEEEVSDLKNQAREMNPRMALSELPHFAKSEEGEEALSKAERVVGEGVLSESIITEGISDRVIRFLAKTGVISGIGLTISGFVGFASNCMGYIDSGFLTKVHEIIDPYCGIFCGPLSVLVIILGAALALGSATIGYRRR